MLVPNHLHGYQLFGHHGIRPARARAATVFSIRAGEALCQRWLLHPSAGFDFMSKILILVSCPIHTLHVIDFDFDSLGGIVSNHLLPRTGMVPMNRVSERLKKKRENQVHLELNGLNFSLLFRRASIRIFLIYFMGAVGDLLQRAVGDFTFL